MEVKEVERILITKPVASKPSCSSFKSFSELLAGAINASPPSGNTRSESAVAAIRPKTVRAKPTVNRASSAMLSSQGEASATRPLVSADKVSKTPDSKSSVLYKPLAKVVSKATVSLLASMGNPNMTHQQALAQVEARAQQVNQSKSHTTNPPVNNIVPLQEQPKPFTANVDRPSYDGYNWRKYGQKQVKGSEYPRSYYKCTHPNCPVKKKVERSLDGQIAEIVYKGEHNHPKPQLPKRSSPADQNGSDPKWSNKVSEVNEGLEGNLVNPGHTHDPRTGGGAPENSCGRSAECEEGSKGLEVDEEMPRSKRRKGGNMNNEAGTSGEGKQEAKISVQSGETEVVGDGFRWRKYGQKVVKGNPYPRSYYKCTSLQCNVRKYVERASDDPSAILTTYEGKHNHDVPTKTQPDKSGPSKTEG